MHTHTWRPSKQSTKSASLNIRTLTVKYFMHKCHYIWKSRSQTISQLPRHNDDKVHDVPRIPEVAVLVEDEAVGQDLYDHLQGEDAHEPRLELLL